MAVEQPLALTLEIMALRAYARTRDDYYRERADEDDGPEGPMVEWVRRVEERRMAPALQAMLEQAGRRARNGEGS